MTLEKATADFINSLPPHFFNFDKIEMTEDEVIIEYHETLADEIEPLNLDIGLTKPLQSLEEIETLNTYFNAVDHAEKNNPISEYHQALVECLKDPSMDGLMAYHGLVAGSGDIISHHNELFEKEDDNGNSDSEK